MSTVLVLMALTGGSVVLVDVFAGPAPAKAQPIEAAELVDMGVSLTEPIPPLALDKRQGGVRHATAWHYAKSRLKADMPMGRDIPVGQVEGNLTTGYVADTNHKALPGTGFIPESGDLKLNGHATAVATYIVGPQSLGQGVKSVHAWTVDDWMGQGYLRLGTADNPRDDHPARVFNHSWIAPKHPGAALVLRRIDYQIDTQDVLVVVGVNNELGEIPDLLASAYNTISVGTSNGTHSDALTTTEGEGRCKPEIYAPGRLTSWTTGLVTGACAALLEFADRLIEADEKNKDAARSEVIKAVLFAGAYRNDRWAPPEGEPLDRKLGAGLVDIDRSLVILDGGFAQPDKPTNQRYGWSFATIGPGKDRTYTFKIDQAQGETGIALVWHRRVLGGKVNLVNQDTGETREVWNPGTFVPNLNLGLIKNNDDGSKTLVAESTSQVDNLELITLPELEPGNYTLRIVRAMDDTNMDWDYAVAWRIEAKE